MKDPIWLEELMADQARAAAEAEKPWQPVFASDHHGRIPIIPMPPRTYDFARVEPHERVYVPCADPRCPVTEGHEHEGGLANREIDPMGLE